MHRDGSIVVMFFKLFAPFGVFKRIKLHFAGLAIKNISALIEC